MRRILWLVTVALGVATMLLVMAMAALADAEDKDAAGAKCSEATLDDGRCEKGDKGSQGPKGEKGDKGSQGPAGPSDAYATPATDLQGITAALGAPSTVAHLDSLPAGTYVLTISMYIQNTGPGRALVRCGGDRIPTHQDVLEPVEPFSGPDGAPAGDIMDSMSFTVPLELQSTETVNLECSALNLDGAGFASGVFARNIYMTALRVENMTRNN